MNRDEQIRAKALEIAVFIKGSPSFPTELINNDFIEWYRPLTEQIENYIRKDQNANPDEPVENN